MKCKNCNATLEDGVTICPSCGADSSKAGAKLSAGKIALLVVLAVVAVAIVVALIWGGMSGDGDADPDETTESTAATIPADGNVDDVTCKGSYSVADAELASLMDTVVATMGDRELTNGQLQVCYWMEFYNFMNSYGSYASYFGLDYASPLDTQLSMDGTYTWQQYFLDSAISSWQVYQALCMAAEEAEYELDAEYADYLNNLADSLETTAVDGGYESAEAMIQADMGPGATVQDYVDYLSNYYLGYMYYNEALEAVSYTDAEIEAYFDEHAAEYAENGLEKDESTYVDVRHILVMVEGGTTDEDGNTTYSHDEWEACRQKAQAILDQWLAGDMTEASFAELANSYSEDTGSNTVGGLYEDVYEGEMVDAFNDWCFDTSRQYGDYDLVKTEYGYHIMFFVDSDYIWYATALTDLLTEAANELMTTAMDKYPMTVDYSSIALGVVNFVETE